MLSIVDLSRGRANYYLQRSKLEYLQGDGADGLWYGKGCVLKGLTGIVSRKDFVSLHQGYLRGEKLKATAGTKDYFAGVDLCFSADKSISGEWAASFPDRRAVIEKCQLEAVRKTLDYLERNATQVRVGAGGKDRQPAFIMAATFLHGLSRAEAGEPDLHTHVSLFGVGVTPDGKTRGTCSELYYVFKMATGAVYRAELARLLEKELALTFYRPTEHTHGADRQKSWCQVKGFPEALRDHWSSRAKDIAEEVAAHGTSGAKAKAVATLTTRQAKKETSMRELFPMWRDQAIRQFGYDPEHTHREAVPKRDNAKEIQDAVSIALQNVTKRESHFAERDLVREVAIEAQGRGLGYSQIMEAVSDTLENAPQVLRLGALKQEPRFSTREVYDLEESLLSEAKSAKGKSAHRVRESSVLRAILETQKEATLKVGSRIELSSEQRKAVQRLTQGDDQIAVVLGEYGSGKSLVSSAGRRAFELDGYRVIHTGTRALRVSRLLSDLDLGILDEAKHHLHQIGKTLVRGIHDDFKRTPILGRFLPRGKNSYQFNPLTVDSKTVLFVEDAHALSVKEMEELLRKVRERGGKVCLLGNPHALPVEGPHSLSPVARILGEAKLTKNFRAHDDADKRALRALSEGQAKEALASFADQGLLHIEATQKAAMRQMVSDWRKDALKNAKENLLICSAGQRAELNSLAQAQMKRAGKLGRKKVTIGDETFHKGDRVAFTRNSTGFGFTNADSGTILRIGKRRITRKLFHGKRFSSLWSMLKYAEKVKKNSGIYVTVKLDSGKVVDIPLAYYEHMRLGYAVTDRDAREVKNAYVLAGPSSFSRENLASLTSHSRFETRIYTDKQTAGDRLQDLARKASRSQAKDLAHDLLTNDQEQRMEITR